MRAAVYPYDFEFMSALRHRDMLDNIEISSLFSPKGFGLQGKDAYYLGNEAAGIIVHSFDDEAFKKVDTLIITESLMKIPEEDRFNEIDIIISNVNTAIDLTYDKGTHSQLKDICKKYKVQYITGFELLADNRKMNLEMVGVPTERNKIVTPIIAVCGISPMTQKFDVQLYFRDRFIKDGYKVSQIGTKEISYLFGFQAWDDTLYDNSYSETEKIGRINQYIKDIEAVERPDVFVIGIPDALIPYTHKHTFRYGIPAYEIFSAVTPDFVLMTLFNGEYTDEFYGEMQNMCKYRYNSDIDCFYNSHFVPISLSINAEKLVYSYGEKMTPKSDNTSVFNPDSLYTDELYRFVLSRLEKYGEFKSY